VRQASAASGLAEKYPHRALRKISSRAPLRIIFWFHLRGRFTGRARAVWPTSLQGYCSIGNTVRTFHRSTPRAMSSERGVYQAPKLPSSKSFEREVLLDALIICGLADNRSPCQIKKNNTFVLREPMALERSRNSICCFKHVHARRPSQTPTTSALAVTRGLNHVRARHPFRTSTTPALIVSRGLQPRPRSPPLADASHVRARRPS
jgi:hypothetical protein